MVSLLDGYRPGFLEVIYGTVRSGKTGTFMNLIERLRWDFDTESMLFKPSIDTRSRGIRTKGGREMEAIPIPCDNPISLLSYVGDFRVIGIDEAQFFDESLVDTVFHLLEGGRSVILSGLDTDFRRNPFGSMPYLISVAHNTNKMITQCKYDGCDNIAMFTQKLEGGDPNKTIEIGDLDIYEPRCLVHHEILE